MQSHFSLTRTKSALTSPDLPSILIQPAHSPKDLIHLSLALTNPHTALTSPHLSLKQLPLLLTDIYRAPLALTQKEPVSGC